MKSRNNRYSTLSPPVPELERDNRKRARFAFDRLYAALVDELLGDAGNPNLRNTLAHAANEASALAWLTPYPTLVLPGLLEEKVREARLRSQRQGEILFRTTAEPASC